MDKTKRSIGFQHLDAATITARNLRLFQESEDGVGIVELAKKYHLSERQVYRILASSDKLSEVIEVLG